jgi:hypothetical protein
MTRASRRPLTKDHLLITHRMGCRTQPWCFLTLAIKRKGSIMAKRKKQPAKVRKKKAPTLANASTVALVFGAPAL